MNRTILRRILFITLIFIAFTLLLTACTDAPTLALMRAPDKTAYEFGEDLDLTGGKLRLTISGVPLEITMKDNPDVSFLGYDCYTLGEQTVTVAYRYGDLSLTVTFSVSVRERASKEVGIRVVPPETVRYVEGQTFDKTGLKVFLRYEDGSETELKEGYRLSVGESVMLQDSGSVTVNYREWKASFRIEVEARRIVELVLIKKPSKTVYVSGESPDLSDAEFAFRYNDGSLETVAIDTKFTVLPEVFRYGDKSFTVVAAESGADIPSVTLEVEVRKKSIVADRREAGAKMLREIPNAPESEATYKDMYFEFDLSADEWSINEWSINGKRYSLIDRLDIEIDANSAAAFTVKAFDFTVNSEGKPMLKIHLYTLLACGSNTVRIETAEEIVDVMIGAEVDADSEIAYRVSDGRVIFSEQASADDKTVAHLFSESSDNISVSVQKPLVSVDSACFVKLPQSFVCSAVWWNGVLALAV